MTTENPKTPLGMKAYCVLHIILLAIIAASLFVLADGMQHPHAVCVDKGAFRDN